MIRHPAKHNYKTDPLGARLNSRRFRDWSRLQSTLLRPLLSRTVHATNREPRVKAYSSQTITMQKNSRNKAETITSGIGVYLSEQYDGILFRRSGSERSAPCVVGITGPDEPPLGNLHLPARRYSKQMRVISWNSSNLADISVVAA